MKFSFFPTPINKGQPFLAQINWSFLSTAITAIANAPSRSFIAKKVALSKSFVSS